MTLEKTEKANILLKKIEKQNGLLNSIEISKKYREEQFKFNHSCVALQIPTELNETIIALIEINVIKEKNKLQKEFEDL